MRGRGDGRQFRPGESGNPNGRPHLPLRDDPDRYYIAFYEGCLGAGMPPNRAAAITTAFMDGAETQLNDALLACPDAARQIKSAWRANIKRCPEGSVVLLYRKRQDSRFNGFPSRIKGVQAKARAAWNGPADDRHWLYNMSLAMAYTWFAPPVEILPYVVFGHADIAGERQFAVDVLLPIISRKTAELADQIPLKP
jgi:hypothetical protein